jgi:hypothetical protein
MGWFPTSFIQVWHNEMKLVCIFKRRHLEKGQTIVLEKVELFLDINSLVDRIVNSISNSA